MEKLNFLDTSKHYNKQCLLLLSCVFMVCCYYVSCAANEHERQALLSFKQFVNDDRCGMLSSWGDHDNNQNYCEWHGVSCNNNGHVTMLKLPGNESAYYSTMININDRTIKGLCLSGNISSSLVFLKQLRYLDLSFNHFKGPIPSFIGSLVNLEYLNLLYSGHSGQIPQQLRNLSKLRYLNLATYYYVYSLTPLFAKNMAWLSRLTSLRTIILSGVDLRKATNWLQAVNNIPFLRVLEFDHCGLPPPFPLPLSYSNSSTTTLSHLILRGNMLNDCSIFEWMFNLSGINNNHLMHLDLSENQLECTLLSNAFGNLHALSFLDLSQNELHGNIPVSFGNLQSLIYLDLSENNFQSFPKTLGNLCSLQELYLYENNIIGELPNIIQSLMGCTSKSLMTLDLAINKIRGPIPDSIGTFSSLRELDLSYNQLYGKISPSLGNLSTLELLYLNGNSLKDTLTDIHFSNLSSLYALFLANNPSLAFNMTVDWVPPFQLDKIYLRNCSLGRSFPNWLLSQTGYSVLDISNAGIVDKIPESFVKSLPLTLVYLNVSHNQIYGTFSDITTDLQLNDSTYYGIVIDLSFNNIEGAIPSIPTNVSLVSLNNNRFSQSLLPFLCPKGSNKQLQSLDLSSNLFSGEIPDCWMKFENLEYLHLENNFFSGAIPSSIGSMINLQVLNLRNNSFSGGIPGSLEKLTYLRIFDLCHNRLSGHVPLWIGSNFEHLIYISLRSNQFVGGIPLSLCQLSYLQILDLSNNNIGGTIPRCISNFTTMCNSPKFLKFYQGPLFYPFAPYVELEKIMWKRTEHTFKDQLSLLKGIDISMNKLEGQIPTEISSLKGLVFLNVSGNHLNGGIPPEIGQLTSLEFLDLSSNHFVGSIPVSLGNLNSWGILNLSNNQLSGQIPQIPRLQSVDASSYAGNPGLCGIPLPNCPWDQTNSTNEEDNANHQNNKEDVFTSMGFYISMVLGFIIGFWGVCGSLLVKISWRRGFFRFVDDCTQKFSLVVSKIIARLPMRH